MAVFLTEQTRNLLRNRNVVIIGDSVQRSVYKDIVSLIHQNRHLTMEELCTKGEPSFQDDNLIEGGKKNGLHNGVNYKEVRKFNDPEFMISFYFVTRCYSPYLLGVLKELGACQPDVIVMNSCLWDLHRYGPHGPAAFKNNLKKLLEELKEKLPTSIFIWTSTLPVDKSCKSGFLPIECQVVQSNEISEGNFFAYQLVNEYGNVFVNLSAYFCHQLHHRAKDGVHWNAIAHRRITNMLLTEIRKLWGHPMGIPFVLMPVPTSQHHHRSASMPGRGYSIYEQRDVHRSIPISSIHHPDFHNDEERVKGPKFDDSAAYYRGHAPHYHDDGRFATGQYYRNDMLVGAQDKAFKKHNIISMVERCFGMSKKRFYSEMESRPFCDRPAKRPCVREDEVHHGNENYYIPVPRPFFQDITTWRPRLFGPSNQNRRNPSEGSRSNVSNIQSGCEYPQWMEHNSNPKQRRRWTIGKKIKSWYKSKFQNKLSSSDSSSSSAKNPVENLPEDASCC